MDVKNFSIGNIPAILWGKESSKLFIAVHGHMSNKADDIIALFAKQAQTKGYQTLSFDLPEHGDRQNDPYPCKAQNCVQDLLKVKRFADSISEDLNLFCCSIGAYFSLLAYKDINLNQSLFLSPVVNMLEIINNIMRFCGITETQLDEQKTVETSIGHTLYWDYYCYVKNNPIKEWNSSTSLLYGSEDEICSFDSVSDFSDKFNCHLSVFDGGEHFFHTQPQLKFFSQWLKNEFL
ncbi:MAG: alpha/beta hydrolase [Desulfobacter sp.]|nr:MAG: alpha/beta hydrolase [Desulfobacter sp.]